MVPPTMTESGHVSHTNVPSPRRHIFEVDENGLAVKINPALMSREQSMGTRKDDENASERFSMIMSMYNERVKSIKIQDEDDEADPGSIMQEQQVDGVVDDSDY